MVRVVNFRDEIRKYRVLQILEFDSNRKRMSIIVKDLQRDKIVIYCKGADSSVFKNCSRGNISSCNADIKRFSEQGWRTLALSFKYIEEDEYVEIEKLLNEAYNDLLNRDEKIEKANETIESDLELIGATAVEDKLQEDVANTLEALRRAGIKIWVLTGDKKETGMQKK